MHLCKLGPRTMALIYHHVLARLLHIALALVLFATSAGATLSVHFCGGQAVAWALNQAADNCGMQQHMLTEPVVADGPQLKRVPCCEDEVSYHKLDVEQSSDLDAQDHEQLSDYQPVVFAAYAKTCPVPTAALTASPIIRPPPRPAPQRIRRAALSTYLI